MLIPLPTSMLKGGNFHMVTPACKGDYLLLPALMMITFHLFSPSFWNLISPSFASKHCTIANEFMKAWRSFFSGQFCQRGRDFSILNPSWIAICFPQYHKILDTSLPSCLWKSTAFNILQSWNFPSHIYIVFLIFTVPCKCLAMNVSHNVREVLRKGMVYYTAHMPRATILLLFVALLFFKPLNSLFHLKILSLFEVFEF